MVTRDDVLTYLQEHLDMALHPKEQVPPELQQKMISSIQGAIDAMGEGDDTKVREMLETQIRTYNRLMATHAELVEPLGKKLPFLNELLAVLK